MEVDALAERILSDITAVLKRDPEIEEFDIIPVVEAQNKSPVIHVGHKVGLQSWCIKHLYQYCYSKLLDWREQRRKVDADTVLRWTVAVLLLNPDVQTAWNVRKEFVLLGNLFAKHDLIFASIVLTRKPKSPEVFAHRKWLLMHISRLASNRPLEDSLLDLVDDEMRVSLSAATRYSNNYHAWSHRVWVLQHLTKLTPEILGKELLANEEWMSTHVSDYSGMQFRQFLLESLSSWWQDCCDQMTVVMEHTSSSEESSHNDHIMTFTNGKPHKQEEVVAIDPSHCEGNGKSPPASPNVIGLLTKELSLVSELILLYPGHEALWYHRRYVVHAFKKNCLLSGKPNVGNVPTAHLKTALSFGPSCKKTKFEVNWWSNHSLHTIEKELAFTEQCCSQLQGDSLQLSLALKHNKWLATCLELT